MSIPMISPITAKTIKELSPNAGMLLYNFDFSSATDAQSLMSLIKSAEVQAASWLGATKGGITIEEGRETWSAEVDGKRMPFVGELYLDTAQPKISTTLVQHNANTVKVASGAADVEGADTATVQHITPRASFTEEDHLDNIVWVTNWGKNGLIVVELRNALCTSGLKFTSKDKDIMEAQVEFMGFADDVEATDELPISYHLYHST